MAMFKRQSKAIADRSTSRDLPPELLAIMPKQKLPPSKPSDVGLVEADLRSWDRLPKEFVKTSPEELREMAKISR